MTEVRPMNPSPLAGSSGAGCESGQDRQLLFLPPKLYHRLMPFQREGVKFALSRHGRCMIADEMGLGKTIQAISVACFYKDEWPLLIVVPSSLKYPWIEEMEKWIPELNPNDISLVENKTDIGRISTSKVTVLGYGLLTNDAKILVDALYKQNFKVVIVDESHYLKSRNAARSKILVPIIQKAKRALLLTGTPALGRPEELFMQIDALYPRRFGTWSDYAAKYCNAHFRFFGNRRQWDCRGASNLDELHQRLNEIMIRRMKDQVLTQLPPKIRQRIPFDLPKEAAKEACASFEEWDKLMRTLGTGTAGTDNPFVEVMGLITRMYKQTAIAKAGAVKDYIKMMLENEKLKFLVFAHHLTMIQACTEAVIEAKTRYIRIDGSVPSSERVHLVHQFQNDPDTRVAVLSIQAAGQGLTFTAATHVVFAELYWNPGHVKQAEDRAHRIGQSSSVHVHYLIAKGTFDTHMWGMLNRKETVTGSTLNGKKEYLKAEIGDKEKWDFLNFSSAWTPSETLPQEDSKDEVFFSHFEKEKQHDIRTYFSPGSGKEKKRKRTTKEDSAVPVMGQSPPEASTAGGPTEQDSSDALCGGETASPIVLGDDPPELDSEPHKKRLRQASQPVGKRTAGENRKSWAGEASSPFSSRGAHRVSEGAPLAPRRLLSDVKRWDCSTCTFTNSSLLPYCEMCDTQRASCGDPSVGLGIQSDGPVSEQPAQESRPQRREPSPSAAGDSDNEDNESPRPRPAVPNEGERQEAEDSTQRNSLSQNNENAECDSADATAYEDLRFCASRNTDRIFLYTKDGDPMNCNFIPLDIKLDIWEDLPEKFKHMAYRRQIVRFVRAWSSLTAMKQRAIRKSGHLFQNPVLALEDIASSQRQQSSTKRYLTKEDVAQASLTKAQRDGGTVRVIARENAFFSKRRGAQQANGIAKEEEGGISAEDPREDSGSTAAPLPPRGESAREGSYLQVVDAEGTPLCLSCQQPCLQPGAPGENSAWDTRFCSHRCQEEFLVRSSQSYLRAKVLETEHGVCQQCGLDAQGLYQRVRDAPTTHRKEMLENTWLSQLSLSQLNEMIRSPAEGQFWQADHIRPVFMGGGQCSLDNLQTLCTVCHRKRTAMQAKQRSQMKKNTAASKLASDIARFFVKK
ncbi:DNA annealing helicase and endonuclease ZRANB3 isoform X2 [Amia ocellicauda]|uniref:DNA annealing helicase and endonuclease ZRANB3 isoform X2 n=1 Tax=Amia ocellicauda TaxID=2972642 RepID=UPI003464A6AB